MPKYNEWFQEFQLHRGRCRPHTQGVAYNQAALLRLASRLYRPSWRTRKSGQGVVSSLIARGLCAKLKVHEALAAYRR